jgi:hypothetical protein
MLNACYLSYYVELTHGHASQTIYTVYKLKAILVRVWLQSRKHPYKSNTFFGKNVMTSRIYANLENDGNSYKNLGNSEPAKNF